MANIYRTFTDKRKREVRVTFDPDGTAFYCGYDLAAMSGYSAPSKVVQCAGTGLYAAESVYRNMEYIDSKKRGVRRFRCFDEQNALKFLERKPAPPRGKRLVQFGGHPPGPPNQPGDRRTARPGGGAAG